MSSDCLSYYYLFSNYDILPILEFNKPYSFVNMKFYNILTVDGYFEVTLN
jgi:hypothetical protein